MGMYLTTAAEVASLLNQKPMQDQMRALHDRLLGDFKRWDRFQKQSRACIQVPEGVLECMPIADASHYAMKYVNGHPENPLSDRASVVSLGLLASVSDGYPLLLTDMTLLTAWRTACMTALVARFALPSDLDSVGMIGLGAQAPFLLQALCAFFPVQQVYAYDLDAASFDRFKTHALSMGISEVVQMMPKEIAAATDCVVTATAKKGDKPVIETDWVRDGMHISAVGGDAPGKAELAPGILPRAQVISDYWPQAWVEGESQHYAKDALSCLGVHELVSDASSARQQDLVGQLTVFDSVGFALEDFSALMFLYAQLEASAHKPIDFLPGLGSTGGWHVKDLYGWSKDQHKT